MISFARVLRGSVLLLFLLPGLGGGTASSADAQVPGRATFGDKTTFQSADVAYAPSADGQAFTISLSAPFEVSTDTSQVGTQAFSVVIPVSGQNIDANVTFQGVVLVTEGALATLIINVNDTITVQRYRPGFDKSVVVRHRYRAKSASQLAITMFLLGERDQAHPKASASMHFDTIDGDLGTPKRRGKR